MMIRRDYFYSDAWQVLEERVEHEPAAERQFIWGVLGMDDLVRRDTRGASTGSSSSSSSSSSSGGAALTEHLYATRDQWHVTGVFNESGTPVGRYAYDAFGKSTVITPSWAVRSSSLYGWETRFGGYRPSMRDLRKGGSSSEESV